MADLLSALLSNQAVELDAEPVTHGTTIGDMYEDLTSEILSRALPESLDLRVVKGFAINDAGTRSGQIDCMVVRGVGRQLPRTSSFEYNIRNIVAIVEVKKTLHSAPLRKALDQLSKIPPIEKEFFDSGAFDKVITANMQIAFAEATGSLVPEKYNDLPVRSRDILAVIVREHQSVLRIAFGVHGFASERRFREAVLSYLQGEPGDARAGVAPTSLPQLIISGDFSIVKANGLPYSGRVHDDWWPLYFSTNATPLLVLLEVLWTRIAKLLPDGGADLWGEDLDQENGRKFLSFRSDLRGRGWEISYTDVDDKALARVETHREWQPVEVSVSEAGLLVLLGDRGFLRLNDPELIDAAVREGASLDEMVARLVDAGLIAHIDGGIRYCTRETEVAYFPNGRIFAGDNNTGRLTRWGLRNSDSPLVRVEPYLLDEAPGD